MKDLDMESKREGTKEMLTSLDIRAGIIKLPKIVSDISEFNPDDEVSITIKKGEVIVKKHKIEK